MIALIKDWHSQGIMNLSPFLKDSNLEVEALDIFCLEAVISVTLLQMAEKNDFSNNLL